MGKGCLSARRDGPARVFLNVILASALLPVPQLLHAGARFRGLPLAQAAVAVPSSSQPPASDGVSLPLLKHGGFGRYFTDSSGSPVYLTGSHYWQNLQNYGTLRPLSEFDYTAYLDFMQSHNHNFMRMWRWESSWQAPWEIGDFYYDPLPYARSGVCCAADGGNKFDLNILNDTFFDRLRQRIIEAGKRGIYVSVMLFEGWSIWNKNKYGNPYLGHPFRANNNINNVNGDETGLDRGYYMHTLDSRLDPKINPYQKAYVRKIIDTVNDLDNVLYEIANESDADSTLQDRSLSSKDWQYDLILYIKKYEADKPKQHPVGMTAGPGLSSAEVNSIVYGSPADWISPTGYASDVAYYQTDPPATDGSKVVIADTDHMLGVSGDEVWVWKSFLRGMNPIYMDNYIEGPADEGGRVAMGQTATYARRINLIALEPRGDLTSTKYALADPGSEYLVFQPGSGSFTVNLAGPSHAYLVEWVNAATYAISSGGAVNGGGTSTFTSPFSQPSVLYLKQQNMAVQNSASMEFAKSISPGELITIKGANLVGPATPENAVIPSSNVVDKMLADTQVLFDDIAGVPLYVSAKQINVVVPYGIADRSSTTVRVIYKDAQSPAVEYSVESATPGIFTSPRPGAGQATARNEDNSVNGVNNPAARGSIVQIFGTGEGVTNPAGVDGLIITRPSQSRYPVATIAATIGGRPAEATYAASSPLLPLGTFQLNLRVPADAPTGNAVPVVITVGGASSQPNVTLAIR